MIEWQIDSTDRILAVHCAGRITATELRSTFAAILASGNWSPTLPVLVDFRARILAEDFGAEDARLIRGLLEDFAHQRATGRWAVLAPTDFQSALLRFVLASINLSPVCCHVFRDRAQAVEWVNAGNGTPYLATA